MYAVLCRHLMLPFRPYREPTDTAPHSGFRTPLPVHATATSHPRTWAPARSKTSRTSSSANTEPPSAVSPRTGSSRPGSPRRPDPSLQPTTAASTVSRPSLFLPLRSRVPHAPAEVRRFGHLLDGLESRQRMPRRPQCLRVWRTRLPGT